MIDFNIPAQPSSYVDLKNSVLNVTLRLTNGDGTLLTDDLSTDTAVTRRHELSLQSLHRHDSENQSMYPRERAHQSVVLQR